MSAETVPVELFEARERDYKRELARLQMQLVRYRRALEAAGIEPPDAEGEELLQMWRDCQVVISTASAFVIRMGSEKELLMDWDDAR